MLARDHGDEWRDVIRTNGDTWLRIAGDPLALTADLYDGRLAGLRVPTLVIHGACDPRTEPGELDAIREALGRTHGSASTSDVREAAKGDVEADPRVGPAWFEVLAEGGHSPHSERATADTVTRRAQHFVSELFPIPPDPPDSSTLPGRP